MRSFLIVFEPPQRKAGKEPNMKKDSARRVSTRKPGSGGVTGDDDGTYLTSRR